MSRAGSLAARRPPGRGGSSAAVVTALVGLVGLAGCGATDRVARACGDLAVARCAVRDRCTAGLGVLVRYGDRATCEEREAAACRLTLGAAGNGYSREQVEACTTALPTQPCNPLFNDLPVPECTVPPGARAVGEACTFNSQCQSTFCSVTMGSPCGQCAAAPVADAPCATKGEVVAGYGCSKVSVTWAELGSEASACDAALPCGAGLTCVGADPQQQLQGTCTASITTAGAECDAERLSGADCDRNQGLYCGADATCAPLGLAPPWGDCGRLLDGTSAMCTWGSVCVFPVGSRQGTCVEAMPDGYPCNSVEGPPCLAPARCLADTDGGTAGTCQLPDPAACG